MNVHNLHSKTMFPTPESPALADRESCRLPGAREAGSGHRVILTDGLGDGIGLPRPSAILVNVPRMTRVSTGPHLHGCTVGITRSRNQQIVITKYSRLDNLLRHQGCAIGSQCGACPGERDRFAERRNR